MATEVLPAGCVRSKMASSHLLALLILVLILCMRYLKLHRIRRYPFPPGPPKRFLIGNILNLPKNPAFEEYQRLGKEYGMFAYPPCIYNLTVDLKDSDILHFGLPGLSIVVLNSQEAAVELLDKRSALYSSRSVII
jgi:hypothetical protein